jgi:hypothetical protein
MLPHAVNLAIGIFNSNRGKENQTLDFTAIGISLNLVGRLDEANWQSKRRSGYHTPHIHARFQRNNYGQIPEHMSG